MNLHLVFVLVGTTHSGNIGAAARAIKNMGFSELRLVDSCSHLTQDAFARASGADAILRNATRFDVLDDAVADCQSVIGTSARDRQLAVPLRHCRDIALELTEQAAEGLTKAALVFGRERSGLSNSEMDRCTRLLRIPCNPEFSSLNLGAAVQVVAYECSQALQGSAPDSVASIDIDSGIDSGQQSTNEDAPASSANMQHFFDHLQRVMESTGFLDPDNPRQLMRRTRRYFERNRPSATELNILRGVLSATEKPFPPAKK